MAKSGFTKELNASALLAYVGRQAVDVGILENAPDYPDGTDILMVANLTEYGGDGGNPPAYHWLKKSMVIDKDKYKRDMIKILKYPAGQIRTSLLRALGKRAVKNIGDHIERNDIGMPANKPSTQKGKGGNSPMVDTAHMIQSLDSRVK